MQLPARRAFSGRWRGGVGGAIPFTVSDNTAARPLAVAAAIRARVARLVLDTAGAGLVG